MKVAIVIPARLESTRLLHKLLLAKTGKTLLQHTWEQACKCRVDVFIASDSWEITQAALVFGASVIQTEKHCSSGTARICEAIQSDTYLKQSNLNGSFPHTTTLDSKDIIVNWQADEPEVDPLMVTRLINKTSALNQLYRRDQIGTLARPLQWKEAVSRSQVKVVCKPDGTAMYFSRCAIPSGGPYWGHVGIYAFPTRFLKRFQGLFGAQPSDLEAAENLEQIRWMERDYPVAVMRMESGYAGIDTRADYDAFVARQTQLKGDQP